jgi:cell division protein FtsB
MCCVRYELAKLTKSVKSLRKDIHALMAANEELANAVTALAQNVSDLQAGAGTVASTVAALRAEIANLTTIISEGATPDQILAHKAAVDELVSRTQGVEDALNSLSAPPVA